MTQKWIRRTFVGSAGPETSELDHCRPVTVGVYSRYRTILPWIGGCAEKFALDGLAVDDLEGSLGSIIEGITNGDLGRVRGDSSDSGEADSGGGVEEWGEVKVEGEVEEEEIDAEIQESSSLER
jgi:hypothetical protein